MAFRMKRHSISPTISRTYLLAQGLVENLSRRSSIFELYYHERNLTHFLSTSLPSFPDLVEISLSCNLGSLLPKHCTGNAIESEYFSLSCGIKLVSVISVQS